MSFPLFNCLKSWLKPGRILASNYMLHFYKKKTNMNLFKLVDKMHDKLLFSHYLHCTAYQCWQPDFPKAIYSTGNVSWKNHIQPNNQMNNFVNMQTQKTGSTHDFRIPQLFSFSLLISQPIFQNFYPLPGKFYRYFCLAVATLSDFSLKSHQKHWKVIKIHCISLQFIETHAKSKVTR